MLAGVQVGNLNKSFTKALLQDPNNKVVQSDCLAKTDDTAIAIQNIMNLQAYNGWIDGLSKYNILSIKMQNQFQNCGINNYLAKYDAALSEIPRMSGVLTNVAAQLAYYYISG